MAKTTSAQKFKTTLSKEARKVYADKGQTTLTYGNGAAVGTEFKLISDLEVLTADINGVQTQYNAWRCEGDSDNRRVVLTPRRMAEFTAYAKDEKFLATVQWMDGKGVEDAFVLSEDAIAGDIDDQFEEIAKYLNANDGKVTLIGKAKHPRFEGSSINIYE